MSKSTVLDKLIEIAERTARMEEDIKDTKDKVAKIESHTSTMNSELGSCMEKIKACQESLEEIKKRSIGYRIRKIDYRYLTAAIAAATFGLSLLTWLISHNLIKI